MADLAKHAGPVFDAIFQHVDDPPPTPVADHADAFVEWTAEHLVHAVNLYTAYPDVTAKEIKALAAAADISGAGELNPFLVILPMKSKLAFVEVQLILRARGRGTTKDLDKVGTPHFAQFVPLEDNQIGFFTVYDGDFDKYIADFTKNIGQVFDLLFKFTKGAPPSPCRKHLQEFIDFAAGANRTPIGFYQAYPGLSVQDIHALIADSKSQAGSAESGAQPRSREIKQERHVSEAGRQGTRSQTKEGGGSLGRLFGRGGHETAESDSHSGSGTKTALDLG